LGGVDFDGLDLDALGLDGFDFQDGPAEARPPPSSA
jgi:hypothetical protein